MPQVLVMVKKAAFGEEWENVHCLRVGASTDPVDDATMVALGVGQAITTATTAAAAPTTVLQRLISFERFLHDDHVTITGVTITDGIPNTLQQYQYHWSSGLAISGGARINQDPLTLALGVATLLINRIPTGFVARMGRMFLRGYLLDTEVAFNAKGGVGWQAPSAQTTAQTMLSTAVTNSKIGDLFNGGTLANTVMYCIPHFANKTQVAGGMKAGTLVSSTPITGFAVGSPRARQMLRGKKKKKAATGTPA